MTLKAREAEEKNEILFNEFVQMDDSKRTKGGMVEGKNCLKEKMWRAIKSHEKF